MSIGCPDCNGTGVIHTFAKVVDCKCKQITSSSSSSSPPSSSEVTPFVIDPTIETTARYRVPIDRPFSIRVPIDAMPYVRQNAMIDKERVFERDIKNDRVLVDEHFSLFVKVANGGRNVIDEHHSININCIWETDKSIISYNSIKKDTDHPFAHFTKQKSKCGLFGPVETVSNETKLMTRDSLNNHIDSLLYMCKCTMRPIASVELLFGMYHTSSTTGEYMYTSMSTARTGLLKYDKKEDNNCYNAIRGVFVTDNVDRTRFDTSTIVEYVVAVRLV